VTGVKQSRSLGGDRKWGSGYRDVLPLVPAWNPGHDPVPFQSDSLRYGGVHPRFFCDALASQ